jgi:hypothetical protein
VIVCWTILAFRILRGRTYTPDRFPDKAGAGNIAPQARKWRQCASIRNLGANFRRLRFDFTVRADIVRRALGLPRSPHATETVGSRTGTIAFTHRSWVASATGASVSQHR